MTDAGTPSPPTAGTLLGLTVHALWAMIRLHAARTSVIHPLLNFLGGYLHRAAPRLDRLLARWQAGRLTPRPGRPRPTKIITEPSQDRARVRLPTSRGWLLRMIQPTAQFTGQVEALLARPEIVELLAASPQAGRILRPLLRMLSYDPPPPILRLPARPRRPRPLRPRAPAIPRIPARQRRAWLTYSPGRLGETHRRFAPPVRKTQPI